MTEGVLCRVSLRISHEAYARLRREDARDSALRTGGRVTAKKPRDTIRRYCGRWPIRGGSATARKIALSLTKQRRAKQNSADA